MVMADDETRSRQSASSSLVDEHPGREHEHEREREREERSGPTGARCGLGLGAWGWRNIYIVSLLVYFVIVLRTVF